MDFKIKFSEQANQSGDAKAGGPPYQIRGKDLDENFKKASPKAPAFDGNNVPYTVDAKDDGWVLKPAAVFDVCENGKPVKWKFFAMRSEAE